MSNYYSDTIRESLQKIARETDSKTTPVTPAQAKNYFSSHKIVIPDTANDYLRRKADYRRRAVSSNFGTY